MPRGELGTGAANAAVRVSHSSQAAAFNGAFDANRFAVYGGESSGDCVALFRKGIENAACF